MKNQNKKTKVFGVLFIVMLALAGLAFDFDKIIATIVLFAIAVFCAGVMVKNNKVE